MGSRGEGTQLGAIYREVSPGFTIMVGPAKRPLFVVSSCSQTRPATLAGPGDAVRVQVSAASPRGHNPLRGCAYHG